MSVQEVMNLVNECLTNTNLSILLYIICAFAFVLLVLLVSAFNFDVDPLALALEIVLAVTTLSSLYGAMEIGKQTMNVQKEISREVIQKKTTNYTTWKKGTNGNYHFDNYQVDGRDVNVTQHQPKLSKPYAKVTKKYISNRFTEKQKKQIKEVLPEHSFDSNAVINE